MEWVEGLVAVAVVGAFAFGHSLGWTLMTRKDRVRALAVKELIREQDEADAKRRLTVPPSPDARSLQAMSFCCDRGHRSDFYVSSWVSRQMAEWNTAWVTCDSCRSEEAATVAVEAAEAIIDGRK